MHYIKRKDCNKHDRTSQCCLQAFSSTSLGFYFTQNYAYYTISNLSNGSSNGTVTLTNQWRRNTSPVQPGGKCKSWYVHKQIGSRNPKEKRIFCYVQIWLRFSHNSDTSCSGWLLSLLHVGLGLLPILLLILLLQYLQTSRYLIIKYTTDMQLNRGKASYQHESQLMVRGNFYQMKSIMDVKKQY